MVSHFGMMCEFPIARISWPTSICKTASSRSDSIDGTNVIFPSRLRSTNFWNASRIRVLSFFSPKNCIFTSDSELLYWTCFNCLVDSFVLNIEENTHNKLTTSKSVIRVIFEIRMNRFTCNGKQTQIALLVEGISRKQIS